MDAEGEVLGRDYDRWFRVNVIICYCFRENVF